MTETRHLMTLTGGTEVKKQRKRKDVGRSVFNTSRQEITADIVFFFSK